MVWKITKDWEKEYCDFGSTTEIIKTPLLLEQASRAVLVGFSCPIEGFDWVIGSGDEARMFSHEIARRLGGKTGFTEKVQKPMTFVLAIKTFFKCIFAIFQGRKYVFEGKSEITLKRFKVEEGERVLVVEDAIISCKTTRKTIAVLEERGAKVFRKVITLANLSGETHLDDREIVALITGSANHH